MDRASLAIFIHELHNQCLYTEASFRVFNQSIQQNMQAGVFYSAQSTLLCASQIAGILWPSQARAKKRGEELREILDLPEKHPLNDKRLTALWEHADEKLEDWIGSTKGEKIIFDHIGSLEDLNTQVKVLEGNIYRLYDPTTMTFYYQGAGFKMQGIADSISDIFSKVISVHRQMFPDQHRPAPASAKSEEKAAEDATAEKTKH